MKCARHEKARDFWCIMYMYFFMQINNVISLWYAVCALDVAVAGLAREIGLISNNETKRPR